MSVVEEEKARRDALLDAGFCLRFGTRIGRERERERRERDRWRERKRGWRR